MKGVARDEFSITQILAGDCVYWSELEFIEVYKPFEACRDQSAGSKSIKNSVPGQPKRERQTEP